MGRVIGVFGKDIESEQLGMVIRIVFTEIHLDIDNQLPGKSLVYAA